MDLPVIRTLRHKRQKAFSNADQLLWRNYRNKVKIEITKNKKSFYDDKVKHLKHEDSRKWWPLVNRLSGRSDKLKPLIIEKDGSVLSNFELAEHLNEFFVSVNAGISNLPSFLPASEPPPVISHVEVYKKLVKINPCKASGADNPAWEVPSRLLP